MAGKVSAKIAARNDEIRRRKANGEKAESLESPEPAQRANDYDGLDMAKLDAELSKNVVEAHISILTEKAHSLKEKHTAWRGLLENMYQLYISASPGSAVAELSLAELLSIGIKLQGVESRIAAQYGLLAVLGMPARLLGGDERDTK